jgi:hypothetical protein
MMSDSDAIRTCEYQVLVRSMTNNAGLSYHLAEIPDLDCRAVGASQSEAVAAARAQALRKLQELVRAARTPPLPSRLSLVAVELPMPRPRPQPVTAGDPTGR